MDDTMGRVTRILAPFLAVVIAIGLLFPACTKIYHYMNEGKCKLLGVVVWNADMLGKIRNVVLSCR